MTVVEALQRVPFLKDFSANGLETLADIARERVLATGTVLFEEGQPGDSLFLVCRGSLRLVQRDGGAGRELAVLGPGDHLGDLGLLARTVRLVTAVAATLETPALRAMPFDPGLQRMVLVGLLGILAGDSVIYWLGRRLGYRIAEFRLLRRLVPPDKLQEVEKRLRRRGKVVVVIARYLPGLRAPTYFTV